MTVRVGVTEADIAAGKAEDCLSCPVALAINRSIGCRSFVKADSVTISTAIGYWVVPLPAEASELVRRFDEGGPVSPVAFDLALPHPGASCGPVVRGSDGD